MNKRRLFITGIPTAGKSYLAKKLAEEVGGICVSVDDMREELAKDERYKKWVNYYLDQDEYTYYTTTTYDEQWENLVKQSEGFWSGILAELAKYADEDRPVIFEGVNILPYLAHRDLQITGIAIIGQSFEETFERNKREPRWGKTEELQKLEAEAFFNGERPHYREEAEKYGYPVFETPDQAWDSAIQILTDEYLDLVDENDLVIGKKRRSEVYAENLSNFRVINAFVVNPKGEIWIPRRAANKRLFPLCLDMSVGGHVESGEIYEQALKRETQEELNIDTDKVMVKFLGHLTPYKDKVSAFMNVYEIKVDEAPNYNKNDFTEYFWLTPKAFFERVTQGDKAKSDLPKLIERFYGIERSLLI